MMIERCLRIRLAQSLRAFPVVALLGPRQAGKTTLARSLLKEWSRDVIYLDLERDSDRGLAEAELYLKVQSGSLVIDLSRTRPARRLATLAGGAIGLPLLRRPPTSHP